MGNENSSIFNNRIAYILLGIFFGALGVHNFYAGRIKQGIGQLLLTLVSPLTFGITLIIAWIWAFVDIITVKTNGNGTPMTM